MDKYLYNFKVIIEWILPVENRQIDFVQWIYDMIAYIRKIHADFISWGAERKDEITWNAQTINLENHLIKIFGEGIYIRNNFRRSLPQFQYPYTDNRNKFNYPYSNSQNRILYPYGDFDSLITAFTVFVPIALTFDPIKMGAIIDEYSLLGTNYNIETI